MGRLSWCFDRSRATGSRSSSPRSSPLPVWSPRAPTAARSRPPDRSPATHCQKRTGPTAPWSITAAPRRSTPLSPIVPHCCASWSTASEPDQMRIGDVNWMQVEEYLRGDDRAVLPLGSTEQHSYLRLTVDCILPERVAADAAEPLGVLVFPVLAYGVTPYFREYPGSISLRVETHLNVVRDILDSMAHSGFRRILIVNGHGGNAAAQ